MTQAEKEQDNGKEKEKEREKEKEKEQQRGVKRPIAPPAILEPMQDQIQSSFVVVIHPGSRTLRIGRATDTLPVTVPHVIARRHKQSGQPRYEDGLLLREGLNKPESKEQRQNGLKMVDQAIWSKKMSNGVRRTPVSAEQARAYNCQVRPAVLDTSSRVKWTNTAHHPPYLVGEEALYVNPSDCYSIHWPVVRGQLNVHPNPGGSLTAVLVDLETIWSHVIKKHLEIPLKDLKYYRCVLLVPNIYNRQHIKEVVNMLLLNMGFSDVGDQKASLCCVEDGVSHWNSRLCLAYGGSDVTCTFFWLPQRAGFPYRDCQLSSRLDCQLLQHLKEKFCHPDQDISGLQDHEFQTRFPEAPALLYQVRLGDEKLQAPMALFYPTTFGIGGQKMTSLQYRSQGDSEDPHDEHSLLATQSKQDQDMDPRLISWKGGAVLACLDTAQEMWIHQREWQRFGIRIFHERAAFGRVQTAGESDSNQIPTQIRFLGLTVHTVFSKCPNRIWLCSNCATLLTDLTGCCSNGASDICHIIATTTTTTTTNMMEAGHLSILALSLSSRGAEHLRRTRPGVPNTSIVALEEVESTSFNAVRSTFFPQLHWEFRAIYLHSCD